MNLVKLHEPRLNQLRKDRFVAIGPSKVGQVRSHK